MIGGVEQLVVKLLNHTQPPGCQLVDPDAVHDAVQPRHGRGLRVPLVLALERTHAGALDKVLCVFAVACQPQREAPQPGQQQGQLGSQDGHGHGVWTVGAGDLFHRNDTTQSVPACRAFAAVLSAME